MGEMVVPAGVEEAQVDDVELPPSDPSFLLGGLGESAVANIWVREVLGAEEGSWEPAGMTLRGLGPGFLRAEMINQVFSFFKIENKYLQFFFNETLRQ